MSIMYKNLCMSDKCHVSMCSFGIIFIIIILCQWKYMQQILTFSLCFCRIFLSRKIFSCVSNFSFSLSLDSPLTDENFYFPRSSETQGRKRERQDTYKKEINSNTKLIIQHKQISLFLYLKAKATELY